MTISFDKENHRYFNEKGQRVLSVTQYLDLAGLVDRDFYTEEGRIRGSAVHEAIHFLNENDLDRNSLHPITKPYVEAYDKFVADTGFVPRLVEHRIYDEIYNYGGTLDVTGTWKLSGGLIIIDYKTGAITDCAQLQLAAYEARLPESHRKFALQLKNDGTYKLSKEFKDGNDIKIFRSVVAVVNYKLAHGLLKLNEFPPLPQLSEDELDATYQASLEETI